MGIRLAADRSAIQPLFQDWPETLIYAVLEGSMGQAYVNDDATAAQIVNGDFAFLAGDAACADAGALARHVPAGFRSTSMIVAPKDECWQAVIERELSGCVTKRERYAFRKDVHRFCPERLRAFAARLPEGVRLSPVDGTLYRLAAAAEWSRDFVSQFRDEDDYLARGLGVMAVRGDEPLAGASSYIVYRGGIEIEVDTRAEYRRQGLATACCARLILACLERGLYPSWDAANRESVALAEKLGYVLDGPYTVYARQVRPET